MARLVKCRKCGAKVDIKEAFKVVVGKANTYYCNEAEYNSILAARKAKDDTFLIPRNSHLFFLPH